MHENPIELSLVSKPEDWLHSSCAAYYGVAKSEIELLYINEKNDESSVMHERDTLLIYRT